MAGGGNPNNDIRVVAACLFSLFIRISATSHTVGDAFGWSTPMADPAIFSKWAAHKTFNVGDVLVFDYRMGHTVAEVSKADYEHCIGTNPVSIVSAGPASVTIKSPGDHYYICTFPGHCSYGQKLAITVASSNPAATPPSPSITPSSTPAASPLPPTTPSSTPSVADVTAATPPSPPKSSGARAGAGFLLPLLFLVAVFMLLAGYL